jgi:hypothetical protein
MQAHINANSVGLEHYKLQVLHASSMEKQLHDFIGKQQTRQLPDETDPLPVDFSSASFLSIWKCSKKLLQTISSVEEFALKSKLAMDLMVKYGDTNKVKDVKFKSLPEIENLIIQLQEIEEVANATNITGLLKNLLILLTSFKDVKSVTFLTEIQNKIDAKESFDSIKESFMSQTKSYFAYLKTFESLVALLEEVMKLDDDWQNSNASKFKEILALQEECRIMVLKSTASELDKITTLTQFRKKIDAIREDLEIPHFGHSGREYGGKNKIEKLVHDRMDMTSPNFFNPYQQIRDEGVFWPNSIMKRKSETSYARFVTFLNATLTTPLNTKDPNDYESVLKKFTLASLSAFCLDYAGLCRVSTIDGLSSKYGPFSYSFPKIALPFGNSTVSPVKIPRVYTSTLVN